uniref:DUF983 domain-containing protein n=1 Tax=Sphingomonas sp. PL-96 TaxID=2887201 RepID=UPI003B63AA5D
MTDPAGAPPESLPAGAPPEPFAAATGGLCPRCGAKTLFAGFIAFAPRCTNCGLDFLRFNVGDGPTVFLTMGIGTLVTVLAVVVELVFSPPTWLHILLWLPLTLGGVAVSLRFTKALLLALEYRNAAREARLTREEP